MKIKNTSFFQSFAIALMVGILLVTLLFFYHRTKHKVTDIEYVPETPSAVVSNKLNCIYFDSSSTLSESFASLLIDTKNGKRKLQILHIGDSHIQADIFTGETRSLLAKWLNDRHPSRGFIFPYQLARTNNPSDYSITSTAIWERIRANSPASNLNLGVSGISIVSHDAKPEISVRLLNEWPKSWKFDLVKVFYHTVGGATIPYPHSNFEALSLGDGYVYFKLHEPTDSITISFITEEGREAQIEVNGFELNNSRSKLTYHATGVNGADVGTFLKSENFSRMLSQINPNVVIISLGTNDVYGNGFNQKAFERNLTTLVKNVKSALQNPIIILTTPGDHLVNREIRNPSLLKVNMAIHDVAKELSCGVWDFYQVMGGDQSVNQWAAKGLMSNDMLHLSPQGYKLQGQLLFEAIIDLVESPKGIVENKSIDNE